MNKMAILFFIGSLLTSQFGYTQVQGRTETETVMISTQKSPVLFDTDDETAEIETPWSQIDPIHLHESVFETKEGGMRVIVGDLIRVSIDMNHLRQKIPAGTTYVWFYRGSMQEDLMNQADFRNPLIWRKDRDNCRRANIYNLDEAMQNDGLKFKYDVDQPVCRIKLVKDYAKNLEKPGVYVTYESTEQTQMQETHSEFEERHMAPYEISAKYVNGYKPWSFTGWKSDQYYELVPRAVGNSPGYRIYRNISYREWYFKPEPNGLVSEIRCHKAYRTMHWYRYNSETRRCEARSKRHRSLNALKSAMARAPQVSNTIGALPRASRTQVLELDALLDSYELFKYRGGGSHKGTATPLTWENTQEALGDFIALPKPYEYEIHVQQKRGDHK